MSGPGLFVFAEHTPDVARIVDHLLEETVEQMRARESYWDLF